AGPTGTARRTRWCARDAIWSGSRPPSTAPAGLRRSGERHDARSPRELRGRHHASGREDRWLRRMRVLRLRRDGEDGQVTRSRAACPIPAWRSNWVTKNRFGLCFFPQLSVPARGLRAARGKFPFLCAAAAGAAKSQTFYELPLLFRRARAGCRRYAILLAGAATRADRADDFAVHDDGKPAFGGHRFLWKCREGGIARGILVREGLARPAEQHRGARLPLRNRGCRQ